MESHERYAQPYVHEYGNVDLTVVYDTVKYDIPDLITALKKLSDT